MNKLTPQNIIDLEYKFGAHNYHPLPVVLKEGKVKELADFAYTLDGDMLKEGYILACQSSLKSDLTVELDKEQKSL